MKGTDAILLLIAALLAGGIGTFIWNSRKRSGETETMRTALYAIANLRYDLRSTEPVSIKFEPSVNKAIERLHKTAVDLQGLIELQARHMVSTMPEEIIEDMEPPAQWNRVTRQGTIHVRKEQ